MSSRRTGFDAKRRTHLSPGTAVRYGGAKRRHIVDLLSSQPDYDLLSDEASTAQNQNNSDSIWRPHGDLVSAASQHEITPSSIAEQYTNLVDNTREVSNNTEEDNMDIFDDIISSDINLFRYDPEVYVNEYSNDLLEMDNTHQDIRIFDSDHSDHSDHSENIQSNNGANDIGLYIDNGDHDGWTQAINASSNGEDVYTVPIQRDIETTSYLFEGQTGVNDDPDADDNFMVSANSNSMDSPYSIESDTSEADENDSLFDENRFFAESSIFEPISIDATDDNTSENENMLTCSSHSSIWTQNSVDQAEILRKLGFEITEIPRTESTMRPFHRNLALWAISAGISRTVYTGLLEVLDSADNLESIKTLPRKLDSLKRGLYGQMESVQLLRRPIPITSTKLPTLSASQRTLTESFMRNIYVSDPIPLIIKLLQSPRFKANSHFGLAQFVQEPSELFHSPAWGSTIRATSGQFALYSDGSPIFPSDIVFFVCSQKHHCQYCQDSRNHCRHIGRVLYVGTKDDRPLVCIQRLLQQHEATEIQLNALRASGLNMATHEVVALCDQTVIVEPNILEYSTTVHCAHRWSLPRDPQKPHPSNFIPSNFEGTLTLCRVLYNDGRVMALKQTKPIRGELEINQFGRDKLIHNLHHTRCISMPIMGFSDGFAITRSIQHSLMGVYITPACLNSSERSKRENVFPITLGPHGSNFNDVIESIPQLRWLEEGINVEWDDGKPMRIYAFILAFTGDMPQQQLNGGFRGPTAIHGCRKCLISNTDRGNLDYDIIGQGRYYYALLEERSLGESKSNLTQQTKFYQDLGLLSTPAPLLQICPALDVTTFLPSDPCHSEYKGISGLAHELLLNVILSKSGRESFANRLHSFPSPSGWTRLQSPIHHLDSYQIQEHARASILFPLVLWQYLETNWITESYQKALTDILGSNRRYKKIRDEITYTFAMIAKSNSLMTSHSLSRSARKDLESSIKLSRDRLQLLFKAAVVAYEKGITELNNKPVWDSSNFDSLSKSGSYWARAICRPNIHVGVHISEEAREYAVPWNFNALSGEDRHRGFKQMATKTNYHEIERTLLFQDCFRRQLQLYTDGAYNISDPERALAIQKSALQCPHVFAKLLSRPVQRQLSDEDTHTTITKLRIDNSDQFIECRAWCPSNHRELNIDIPVRLSHLEHDHPFTSLLYGAYRTDFNSPNITNVGRTPIKWFRKVSLSSKTFDHNLTFTTKDFVFYRDGYIGQVIGFFSHQLPQQTPQIFAYLQRVKVFNILDRVIQLPRAILRCQKYAVVGLSQIEHRKAFLIPHRINLIQKKRTGHGHENTEEEEREEVDGPTTKPLQLIYCNLDIKYF